MPPTPQDPDLTHPAHDVASPTSEFHVADLGPAGDLRSSEAYSYDLISRIPGAADLITLFSTHLYRAPESFDLLLAHELSLRFVAPAPTTGIATLRDRAKSELISLSVLLSGRDPTSDAITLDAVQKHLLRELRDTPHEPAFGLTAVTARPLVATLVFSDPPAGPARPVAALTDRCLAASFFRFLRVG